MGGHHKGDGMDFSVWQGQGWRPPPHAQGIFLVPDNWDDYSYKTLFTLLYGAPDRMHEIGQVKIGMFGMEPPSRTSLPEHFQVLGEEYFSLGQDDTYYENLRELGDHIRVPVLQALRDVAFDLDLFERARSERVFEVSLLRTVTDATARDQYHRIATGGETLALYKFAYEGPPADIGGEPRSKLEFEVYPKSRPPTNIHALIGSNGVGKTQLLHRLARAVADKEASVSQVGRVIDLATRRHQPFVNVVVVSFSAFDQLERFGDSGELRGSEEVRCTFVTLPPRTDTETETDEQSRRGTGPYTEHANAYADVLASNFNTAKRRRWEGAVRTLEADPLFADADVVSSSYESSHARALFDTFSSGHKIVLLAVTHLAAHVAERSLVLIDEPETHLHPPLLSAFIRAVSDLLVDRNGVAIVATHSPVVLQEAPRNCVWKLRRSGQVMRADRPTIETFGENVGVLTREVFGLEVTRSGFHQELESAVAEGLTFEEILQRFKGQLGGEAQTVARALIAVRREPGDL
jgi:predicted ATPase